MLDCWATDDQALKISNIFIILYRIQPIITHIYLSSIWEYIFQNGPINALDNNVTTSAKQSPALSNPLPDLALNHGAAAADLNRTFLLISRHSQLLLTVNDDAIPAVAFNRRTILTKKDAPGYDSAVSAPFYTTTNRVTNCAGDSRRSLRLRSKSKEDFTKNFATASFATAEQPHGRRWTDTNAAVYKIQRRRLQVIQSLVQVQLITTTDKSRPKREREWALITIRLFHGKKW